MYASTNNAIFSLLSAYICLAYQLRLLRKTCLTCVVINRKIFFFQRRLVKPSLRCIDVKKFRDITQDSQQQHKFLMAYTCKQ